ncbi:MAG TPA: BTAD domain-containing putative transcriptional regulator [Nocardioides sp.]|nr:BTAD domain-containing putative transcriptional regulator [Nocardioides sp.]
MSAPLLGLAPEPAVALAHSPRLAADALLSDAATAADPLAWARRHASRLTALLLREHWIALLDRLAPADAPLPGWLAWRATYGLHHLGHLRDAAAVSERADPGSDPGDLARLSAIRASIAWKRGDHGAARRHADEAVDLDGAADGAAQGYVDIAQALLSAADGNRDANFWYYERAKAWAQRQGDDLTLERVLNNLASRSLEEGDPTTAVSLAIAGQQVNLRTGHQSGLALLRHNLAEALMTLGRLDEALAAAHQARAFYASADSPNSGSSWQLVGDIQATLGLATQAAASYRHAIAAAEIEHDAQVLVPSLAGLALVTALEDPAGARELIARVEREPIAVRGAVGLTAAAWVHLCTGDPAAARAQAELAVVESGRVNDLTRTAEALEVLCLIDGEPAGSARLREAGHLRHRIGDPIRVAVHRLVVAHLGRDPLERRLATQQLRALGVVADAGRIAGQLHVVGAETASASIRVHSLGGFVVLRDGTPIGSSEWPSRKAHEALRLIAAHGVAGLTRAQLAQLLWPDTRDVSNRLSVALSHLRTALDPERRFPADHFLRADGGRLALVPEHVEHDVDEFRHAARAALALVPARSAARAGSDGEQALAALEAAASLYTGPFAEGEDAEWADDLRQELDAEARRVVRAIADLHVGRGAPDAAVPWLTRLLSGDPYDEPDHLALIGALSDARRFGEARLAHSRYLERMDELGVDAVPWESVRP